MEHIYADIMRSEKEERSMLEWLQTLSLHSYQMYIDPPPKANLSDEEKTPNKKINEIKNGSQEVSGDQSQQSSIDCDRKSDANPSSASGEPQVASSIGLSKDSNHSVDAEGDEASAPSKVSSTA